MTIVVADYFCDGGSMMLKFRDATGRELIVVHYTPLVEGDEAAREREVRKLWHFYAGGFPTDRGAVRLQAGDGDERELQRLVGDCITRAEEAGGRLVRRDDRSETYDARWGDHDDRNVRGFQARLAKEIQEAGPGGAAAGTPRPN